MPRQLAAMAAALVMLLALVAGILEPLEQRLSDAWFGLAKVAPSGRTVVVAFDHAPGPLGGARRVSRREVADLLMRLDAAGAARILVDIGLAEPMSPPEDNALERALARLGRKVGLTMNAVITVNQTTWRRSVVMERFARHATRTASDLGLDRDGRIRRSGIEDSGLPHLVPSPVWLNGPQPRRDEAPDVFRIDFGIDLARIPHIDAATILQGGTTGLADANVIVAGYPPAAGKGAPVPRYDELSRAQVTALAAETLALGRTIRALPAWLSGAGAVAFAGLATLWCMRRRTLAAAALCAAAVLGATAVGAALQIFAGVLVPTVGIATAALLGFAAAQAMVHPAFQRLRQAAFAVVENIDIEALSRNATEDALTGVPNRRAFEQALQRACADGNGSFALLLCDLDGFKPINDTMGHQAGDALLREIATRLVAAIGPGGLVARLGGDEFAALIPRATEPVAAAAAKRLVDAVVRPIKIEGRSVSVGVSVGVALATDHDDAHAVIERADAAMYAAKRSRTGYGFARAPAERDAPVALVPGLRGAVRVNEFARQA